MFKIFVITSFIGIAVFGFTAMNHNGEHSGVAGCIAAATKGIDCENGINAINLAFFHLDAFRDFSKAVLSDSFTSSAILLIFVFVFLNLVSREKKDLVSLRRLSPRFKYEKFLELFCFPQKTVFNHWLALHENSPSIFA